MRPAWPGVAGRAQSHDLFRRLGPVHEAAHSGYEVLPFGCLLNPLDAARKQPHVDRPTVSGCWGADR